MKIAGNGGGAQALQTVLDLEPALSERGFSRADIIRIAGHDGGAQALQAVLDYEQ